MASSFSFPILSDAELLPCLREMEMPVAAAQLAKPSAEFVRPIYETLVTNLTGLSREDLQQPVLAATDVLEFPELHEESIPAFAFSSSLARLVAAVGIKDFTLREDLWKPEGPRLRRILSGIINFAKFREEKLGPYLELQEQLEAIFEDQQKLSLQHAQQAAEIEALHKTRSDEEPDVAMLEADAAKGYSHNQQLNKQQVALSNEVKALRNQIASISEQSGAERLKLLDARQEADRLSGLIVESPEKLQQMVEEVAAAVEKERSLISDADRRSRDCSSRADAVAKVEKDLGKAMKQLEELEAEVARKKEVSRRVKDLRRQIAVGESDCQAQAATQQHLTRQQAALHDRLHRLDQQAAVKKEAAALAVEEQVREKEAVEAENAAAQAKIAENEAMMRTLQERVRELQSNHDAEVSSIMAKYRSLREQMAEYHMQLETAMAMEQD
ncbi:hypothetical protein WJX74_005779 [Apatococcus lobatus]|uniref:Uncharacterized protein n=1 Tax=Apatococcus lobatus TaxID=904363 RepID=A0AAW1QJ73_9CHLO